MSCPRSYPSLRPPPLATAACLAPAVVAALLLAPPSPTHTPFAPQQPLSPPDTPNWFGMRRQLGSYSSNSSTSSLSSPDGPYGDASHSDPPSSNPPLFRRASSLDSMGAGYISPDDEQEGDELADGTDALHIDSTSIGLGMCSGGRTPRLPACRTIAEDAAEDPPPVYADLLIARTRSMPLPRSTPSAAGSSLPSPSSAASADAATSSLPGSQPNFGSSQSWTPGLAPPSPYVAITPVSSHDSDDLPPPQPYSNGHSDPRSALDGSGQREDGGGVLVAHLLPADRDDLPPPSLDSSAWDYVSRAPPPSRAPSLVRQKGVYLSETSRALSVPLSSAARQRYHLQLQQTVRAQEEQRRAAQNGEQEISHLLPPLPPLRYDDDDDEPHTATAVDGIDADDDQLPPM